MANYLVTGAAGFIGANIAHKLLKQGHKVCTIDNLSTGYVESIPEKCRFIHGDISDIQSINKLNNEKFDAILHIAGQSSGEVSFENPVCDINSNAVSTLRLLDFAIKTNCKRFIYASSMSVYGQQGSKEQYSELDKTTPKSFYAVGKLASEHYLRIYQEQYDIDCTILRYFNVYGPGQRANSPYSSVIPIFINRILKKLPVKN